jgi:hypothetical protein
MVKNLLICVLLFSALHSNAQLKRHQLVGYYRHMEKTEGPRHIENDDGSWDEVEAEAPRWDTMHLKRNGEVEHDTWFGDRFGTWELKNDTILITYMSYMRGMTETLRVPNIEKYLVNQSGRLLSSPNGHFNYHRIKRKSRHF